MKFAPMHRQAGIAWLIILLQAAMFWYMSETIVFPILVALISSPAVWWASSVGSRSGVFAVDRFGARGGLRVAVESRRMSHRR